MHRQWPTQKRLKTNSLRLLRLEKRELILVLFVCLIDLCLLGFVDFLLLLMSGKGCGLWLWHSLNFSLTFFIYDGLDSVISTAPRTDKHPPRGLQCQDGHRPPDLGRSDWIWRCRGVQQQWTPPFKEVCRAWITDHQHSLPSTNSQKDNMDAPSLQTLASHWLCHSAKEGQTGCQIDVWCRLLDRSQACCQQTQPAHSACTTTTRQGKKGPKKFNVSKLKQDSKRQAFVNDLCSRLDALEHSSEDVDESWTVFRDTVHSSAMDSLGPVSRKHQDWFDENDKEIQGLLEEKHHKPKAYLAEK